MSYNCPTRNLDGTGPRRVRRYSLPPNRLGYWAAVTDVACPGCPAGLIRWAEAGRVPGYRVCDVCRRHWLAEGDAEDPALLLVRGGV